MKWSELKNSGGFCSTWLILAIYSAVMFFYNKQISILGFIISILFGFLGFDMMNTVASNLGRKSRGKKK